MSYRWESEKIAQWRLKARHGGLDENEWLLYEDYLQSCALAEADVNASKARSMGRLSERRLKKGAIRRGVISLALVALIGMYAMTGCKLSESILLVPYTTYEIGYKLTGELPDTNKVLSSIANTMRLLSGGGSWDLGSFIQSGHASVARLASGQVPPDECFFDEVVSHLRGTSDMTEVHRHIWSDEALWNFEVYLKQKEDSSYDPGTYDGNGYDGRQIIEDLGGGYGGNAVKDLAED